MLVLSRKVGEKLIIGDGIVITVNRIVGQRVSLGIEAPPHVRIVRGELEVLERPSSSADNSPLACTHV
ncbi:MAG TPA: carbon storage regulator [Pirellulales bacterium]|nr:carbon storage regulator [Pirellulales bacterium]